MSIARLRTRRVKISGYRYAIIHSAMHVVLAGLLYFAVQPDLITNLPKMLPILVGMVIVDLDHIPIWRERGIRGYLKLRSMEEFGKPRRYALHNFFTMVASLAGSLLMLFSEFFTIGLFFASLAVHLLWDFLEDILIFDMGYGHWI